MSPKLSKALRGYGIAAGSTLVVSVLRYVLNPYFEGLPVIGLFLVSVAISGHFGGLGPSIFALIAGAVPVSFFFPDWPPSLFDPTVQVRLLVYLVLGAIMVLLNYSERKLREDLEAEQDILRQTIELQERERRLIAYDIHDGTIQYATAAMMYLEGYKAKHKNSPDIEQIKPVLTAIRRTIDEGRRVMNGIRSPVLDDAGVVAAIEQLIGEKQIPDMEIEFTHEGYVGRMTPELESAVFRIAQELLNNALKHSKSTKVQLALVVKAGRIWLTAQDWGIGFAPKIQVRGVHGLRGIRERITLLGGHFKCNSAVGRGTRFEIDLPYRAALHTPDK